jgi:DNA repair protein RadC
MYDIGKLEKNRIVRAMLWNPERLLASLFELRNQGIISKVSEIDTIRQFTTRYALEDAIKHLVAGGNKA